MIRLYQSLLTLVLAGFSCAPALANQWLLTDTPFHDMEPGSAGIGYALRWGQSPYVNVENIGSVYDDGNSDLVPLYLYEGRYFYSHGTEWGVHAFDPGWLQLDLIARYRFDRLQVESSSFFDGLEDRRQTVDGGLAIGIVGQPWGEVRLTAVTDLLDRHNGEEVDLSYRYRWQRGRMSVSPWASLYYQSAGLTGYYYGVSAEEALPDRPVYTPDSVYSWRAGINSAFQAWENWHVFLNLSYEKLGEAVTESPLTDKSSLLSAYFGFSYSLGNALDAKVRKPGTRKNSWRFNAGYTVQDTFSQVLLGNFKQHRDIDTYMAGLTFGRLLKDGRRSQIWGRFSVNRRFENDFQDDFFEYVAYAMAFGTGYSPWTDRELFRFGFGLGISYAEKVPAVEQFKQAGRDEQTSRWLNYMEAQVDFPLRNLFGDRAGNDCYVGLTLVHRSGIFGRADVFNSTQGGSEVLTGHIECKY